MSDTAYLDDLNDAQREAVTHGLHIDGRFDCDPLLVIAGAGSGKTQALSHRAAHLVLSGVDPRRILLLTFSRRAADEMTRRAHAVVEAAFAARGRRTAGLKLPWAGTFHAIGARLLREEAGALGLDGQFSILDRGDAADLLDVCRQNLNLGAGKTRFPRKDTCLGIYSQVVNRQTTLADVLATRYPWCAEHHDGLKALFAAYTERKLARATLDYDDLLLYWAMMMGHDALAEAVAGRFDHVLVDEYQDTNILQAAILKRLCPDGRGLCVVGDDAQAIYGFRAAEVANILGFANDYPGCMTVRLERNYRSTGAILDAANALIGEASTGYHKTLYSHRGAGMKPRHVTVRDSVDEARYVVDRVLERRETGVELKQQAVLFRNAHHANDVEVELIRRDIPFRKYGGLKFLEAAHVKDLLALLRLAENPRDEIAAYRAFQLVPGVGPGTARQAWEHLQSHNDSLSALAGFRLPRGDRDVWQALAGQLAEAVHADWPAGVEPLAAWYKRMLDERFEPPTTARAGDIDDLVRMAAQHADRAAFLTDLTLDPPSATGDHNDDAHLDEDYLVLSTVHSAKGREFDSVYLLHVADGTFPNEYSTSSDAALDEERRLMYVAFTRAKNTLEIVSPLRYYVTEQHRHGDRHVYGATSRFLTPRVMRHFEAVTDGTVEPARTSAAQTPRPPQIDIAAGARALWQ
ncbi:ATP-dependent helicase [Salinisphaera sp.]|uniref:ATP-dependent helicase n=1 Tax=Salinisphaera sp. TaxID=1914330 RepID=UPI000C5F4DB0|nr:ATP-dependent helicase [Salinisphaera sp.]MBS63429.1 ATP-dependent DNA helicase [Salinisphaera sp.]